MKVRRDQCHSLLEAMFAHDRGEASRRLRDLVEGLKDDVQDKFACLPKMDGVPEARARDEYRESLQGLADSFSSILKNAGNTGTAAAFLEVCDVLCRWYVESYRLYEARCKVLEKAKGARSSRRSAVYRGYLAGLASAGAAVSLMVKREEIQPSAAELFFVELEKVQLHVKSAFPAGALVLAPKKLLQREVTHRLMHAVVRMGFDATPPIGSLTRAAEIANAIAAPHRLGVSKETVRSYASDLVQVDRGAGKTPYRA